MLEPRVFDLLLYLVVNRDRVVPQTELLATHASRASLARCIMKIRTAVDQAGSESVIRTMHRVGYRFIGSVGSTLAASMNADAIPVAPTVDLKLASRSRRIVVAVLPTLLSTGDPRTAWFGPIVRELILKTVGKNQRFEMLSLDTVLSAIRNSGSGAELLRIDGRFLQGLRADCAIEPGVHLVDDRFILSWKLFGGRDVRVNEMSGAVLVELASSAAAKITSDILGLENAMQGEVVEPVSVAEDA